MRSRNSPRCCTCGGRLQAALGRLKPAPTAVVVFVACLLLAGSAGGQTDRSRRRLQPFSNAEIAKAVETVRADPNLGSTRTIRTLQWRESEGRPWNWPSWLSWIGDLIRFVAQSGRALFWIGIVALALFLVCVSRPRAVWQEWTVYARANSSHRRTSAISTSDPRACRPTSAPPHDSCGIAASVAPRWRCSIADCCHGWRTSTRCRFAIRRPKATACRSRVQHLDETRHAYVTQLVRTWQRAVYGGTEPDSATVYALCDAFGRTLDQPVAPRLTSLDVAEASA